MRISHVVAFAIIGTYLRYIYPEIKLFIPYLAFLSKRRTTSRKEKKRKGY